ncbi:hypothetical protein PHLCEN_2v8161 [Hermanssonia centrifuga]|uniref:Uncharacterized protein n=1 Tax=Hermanssonia centrifuga TaxID=98765 RepID=A0A2R6NUG0_9APHY|nr:hypothetical protein PHLCEN_2v8161 [Hermanssonia centrifuga]
MGSKAKAQKELEGGNVRGVATRHDTPQGPDVTQKNVQCVGDVGDSCRGRSFGE